MTGNGSKTGALSDRDERGMFKPGHSGGPGRPRKEPDLPAARLRQLAEECTPSDWKEICRAQIDKARKGNLAATKWLSRHLLPQRPQFDSLVINNNFARPLPTESELHARLFEVLGIELPAIEPPKDHQSVGDES